MALALAPLLGGPDLKAQQKPQVSKEVMKEDILVFRVQTRQVFFSNLKVYLSHLDDFNCLFPQAKLLKLSGVDYKQLEILKKQSIADVQQFSETYKKLMHLILAQVYTNSLKLSLERDFDLKLALDKCGLKRFGSWDNELKSLVQAELYMRQGDERPTRFDSESRQRHYQKIDQKMDYEFYL